MRARRKPAFCDMFKRLLLGGVTFSYSTFFEHYFFYTRFLWLQLLWYFFLICENSIIFDNQQMFIIIDRRRILSFLDRIPHQSTVTTS